LFSALLFQTLCLYSVLCGNVWHPYKTTGNIIAV
jgi:hypothetical protein